MTSRDPIAILAKPMAPYLGHLKAMLYMSCRGKCRRGSGRDHLGDIGGKCRNMSARPQKNTKTLIFFNFLNL
jgi:hypothetical protein